MKTFKQFLEEEREIYAKKLGRVPEWTPSLAEGDYQVGGVTFSAADGLGSVPNNQSVYYFGCVVMIKPSVFKQLALPDEAEPRAKDLVKLVKEGYALGIPFFTLSLKQFKEDGKPPQITGHEGRGRMLAVQMINGDEPVPVHIFLDGGGRGRDLIRSSDLVQAIKGRVQAEDSQAVITSPFIDVFVDGKRA